MSSIWGSGHSSRYNIVAPESLYGKVPIIKKDLSVVEKLIDEEIRRLAPKPTRGNRDTELACIYLGTDENGKTYIGQTIGAPEYRFKQHRDSGSGPFKDGEKYVEWQILEKRVEPADLNRKESFYIGYYNSFDNGYNDTHGNDFSAYQEGVTAAKSTLSRSGDTTI